VLPINAVVVGLVDESENTANPVPVRAAACGLPTALSLTVSEPVRAPLAVGVKMTLTVQLCPTLSTLSVAPHVFVWVKSPLVAI
jgi:hypothetical protein